MKANELTDNTWTRKFNRYEWAITNVKVPCIPGGPAAVPLDPPSAFRLVTVLAAGTTWDLLSTYEFTNVNNASVPVTQGDGQIRGLDAQGNELYSTRFTSDSDPDAANFQAIEVPALPATNRIELLKNGVLQDTIVRSQHAPAVSITSPLPGSTLNSSSTVEWQASDADGDPLQALIQYSPDNGATWRGVQARPSGSQVSLGADWMPSSNNAKIRVSVTDGMNTAVAEVGNLTLSPNRPPSTGINTPRDGATFRAGAMVTLIGTGYDLEDGWLGTTSLSWYSSIDGFLGNGSGLSIASLSNGTHTIELRASDSQGAIGSKTVSIMLAP
jgi:hypothetical protein